MASNMFQNNANTQAQGASTIGNLMMPSFGSEIQAKAVQADKDAELKKQELWNNLGVSMATLANARGMQKETIAANSQAADKTIQANKETVENAQGFELYKQERVDQKKKEEESEKGQVFSQVAAVNNMASTEGWTNDNLKGLEQITGNPELMAQLAKHDPETAKKWSNAGALRQESFNQLFDAEEALTKSGASQEEINALHAKYPSFSPQEQLKYTEARNNAKLEMAAGKKKLENDVIESSLKIEKTQADIEKTRLESDKIHIENQLLEMYPTTGKSSGDSIADFKARQTHAINNPTATEGDRTRFGLITNTNQVLNNLKPSGLDRKADPNILQVGIDRASSLMVEHGGNVPLVVESLTKGMEKGAAKTKYEKRINNIITNPDGIKGEDLKDPKLMAAYTYGLQVKKNPQGVSGFNRIYNDKSLFDANAQSLQRDQWDYAAKTGGTPTPGNIIVKQGVKDMGYGSFANTLYGGGTLTSTQGDYKRKNTKSFHDVGLAFDFVPEGNVTIESAQQKVDQTKALFKQLGIEAEVINEYDPKQQTGDTTGNHIHTAFKSPADKAKFEKYMSQQQPNTAVAATVGGAVGASTQSGENVGKKAAEPKTEKSRPKIKITKGGVTYEMDAPIPLAEKATNAVKNAVVGTVGFIGDSFISVGESAMWAGHGLARTAYNSAGDIATLQASRMPINPMNLAYVEKMRSGIPQEVYDAQYLLWFDKGIKNEKEWKGKTFFDFLKAK